VPDTGRASRRPSRAPSQNRPRQAPDALAHVTVDTARVSFTHRPRVTSPAGNDIHHTPCTLFCGSCQPIVCRYQRPAATCSRSSSWNTDRPPVAVLTTGTTTLDQHAHEPSRGRLSAHGASKGVMANSLEAKIVVLGSQGVGKTSLVHRYVKNAFTPPDTQSTIGASFLTKRVVDIDSSTIVRLQIWDTAGQERFRSISKLYYRGTFAARSYKTFDMQQLHYFVLSLCGSLCPMSPYLDIKLVMRIPRLSDCPTPA
jgi:hypothetical protein